MLQVVLDASASGGGNWATVATISTRLHRCLEILVVVTGVAFVLATFATHLVDQLPSGVRELDPVRYVSADKSADQLSWNAALGQHPGFLQAGETTIVVGVHSLGLHEPAVVDQRGFGVQQDAALAAGEFLCCGHAAPSFMDAW